MSILIDVEPKRLVKLIKKAQKRMPEAPAFTEKAATCWRCNGSGVYEWGGSINGVSRFSGCCFRCLGNGVDPKDKIYTIELDTASPEWTEWAVSKITKQDESAEKRKAKKEAKIAAEVAEKEKEASDRLESLKSGSDVLKAASEASEALEKADRFAFGVLQTILNKGYMSEKQEAILERGVERISQKAAEDAAASPVIEGRIEISGIVKATKEVEGDYGISYKMLVLDSRGFKVWGTIPSAINPSRGDKVTFVATVEKSPDDECFGFYKRPTKAVSEEVVEEVA